MTRQELKNTLEQVDCILDLQEELTHYDGIDTDLFLARAYQLGLETGLEAEEGVKGTLTQDYLSPSELMIGDWVVYHGDVDYEYPHKITGLATEDISVGEDGFLGGWKEMVSPIPLTEDILKANFGERKDGNCGNGYYFYGKDKKAENCVDIGDIILNRYSFDEYNIAVPCYYVHELQQFLRLGGYTELANNFKLS